MPSLRSRGSQVGSKVRSVAAALLLAAVAATPAGAQPADAPILTEEGGANVLVGRWSGSGFVLGVPGAGPPGKLTVDLAPCEGKICGRLVGDDGRCSDVVIEVALASPAGPGRVTEAGSFDGRLLARTGPSVAIRVWHQAPADGAPRRLLLAEAGQPLYTRRMPDRISGRLDHAGPPRCAPRATS